MQTFKIGMIEVGERPGERTAQRAGNDGAAGAGENHRSANCPLADRKVSSHSLQIE